jgi:hypothetical protein
LGGNDEEEEEPCLVLPVAVAAAVPRFGVDAADAGAELDPGASPPDGAAFPAPPPAVDVDMAGAACGSAVLAEDEDEAVEAPASEVATE